MKLKNTRYLIFGAIVIVIGFFMWTQLVELGEETKKLIEPLSNRH